MTEPINHKDGAVRLVNTCPTCWIVQEYIRGIWITRSGRFATEADARKAIERECFARMIPVPKEIPILK